MIFLDLEDLLRVAERAMGARPEVRDVGLLESALARPRTTVFGEDAYVGVHEKAAALMHSVARNHALVDGNKRLALASVIAFYGVNGMRLTFSLDAAYELTMAVATGALDDVRAIAAELERGTEPRS